MDKLEPGPTLREALQFLSIDASVERPVLAMVFGDDAFIGPSQILAWEAFACLALYKEMLGVLPRWLLLSNKKFDFFCRKVFPLAQIEWRDCWRIPDDTAFVSQPLMIVNNQRLHLSGRIWDLETLLRIDSEGAVPPVRTSLAIFPYPVARLNYTTFIRWRAENAAYQIAESEGDIHERGLVRDDAAGSVG